MARGRRNSVGRRSVETPTEVVAVDDSVVLYRGEWGGAGGASGIEAFSSITGLYTIRDGQICRAEWFFDHDQALKAAGLAE